MPSKKVKPQVEKFFIEMDRFFTTHNYKVSEMLYSLDREISKTGKSVLELKDEEILECLERANINERD